MKPRAIQKFVKLVAAALGLLAIAGARAGAGPQELIVGVSFTGDSLFSFKSDDPGTILESHAISGLVGGEQIETINYWNGQIYGWSSLGGLYAIDPANGQASLIGNGNSAGAKGTAFGFANTPAGGVVVSELDIRLNICRTTGICSTDPVLAYAPGDLFAGTNPNITSLAYDHGNGVLYGLDSLRKTMVRLDPATGLLNTLTPSGIGVSYSRYNGFDISDATGIAYLGSPASDDDPQANLYTLDVATGQATLVGTIGDPGDDLLIRGMTVVPWSATASTVPEPSVMALLGLGAVALAGRVARRRNG